MKFLVQKSVASHYQLTEKTEYYDFLLNEKYYLTNTFFEVPNVIQMLDNTLRKDDGSDQNAQGREALLSLLARENGQEVVENFLIDVFEEKIKSRLDATLKYEIAAAINSDRLNVAVEKYEAKYANGLWAYYIMRKGWPVHHLLVNIEY